MARITTTTQMKNQTIPGIAYLPTVLDLATGPSYPASPDLFRKYDRSATVPGAGGAIVISGGCAGRGCLSPGSGAHRGSSRCAGQARGVTLEP